MYLSLIDRWVLLSSTWLYFINYLISDPSQWKTTLFYGFLSSFFGWEYFWAIGFSPESDDYITRAHQHHYLHVTSNNTLHAIINAIGDTAILQTILFTTNLFIPGLQKFQLKYLSTIFLLGIIQNIIVDYYDFTPISNNMSRAPLAINCNCPHLKIICWNNQQEWIYYLTINYLILLFHKRP